VERKAKRQTANAAPDDDDVVHVPSPASFQGGSGE
jgi:hypothetical protein